MAHQYSDALRSLVPKAKLSIMNEDYETLQWDESNTDTKPTKAESVSYTHLTLPTPPYV